MWVQIPPRALYLFFIFYKVWFDSFYFFNYFVNNQIFINFSSKLVGREGLNFFLLGAFKFNSYYNVLDSTILNLSIKESKNSLKNLYLPNLYLLDMYYLKNPESFIFFIIRFMMFYRILCSFFFIIFFSLIFKLNLFYITYLVSLTLYNMKKLILYKFSFLFVEYYKNLYKLKGMLYKRFFLNSRKFFYKKYKKKIYKRFRFLKRFNI